MASNALFVQTQKLTLSGSGCTSTATTITLSSFKLPDGVTPVTMSNFGNIGYMTLEPGTVREENISFTGITQNSDGSATLTGVTKGLSFVSPYSQVSGFELPHAGGSVAVVSNSAPFYHELTSVDNDEIINSLWTFIQYPQIQTYSTVPTLAAQFATKYYVDQTAIAGAPNASSSVKGIVTLSVDPASPTSPIAMGANDSKISPVSLATLTSGMVSAWAGTSGTAPSGSNKFVDNADTSSSPTGSQVVRLTSSKLPAVDGSNLTNLTIPVQPNLGSSFTAGTTITTGQPVYVGPYQSDGGIKIDVAGTFSSSINSLTVANNSNRVLVVIVTLSGTSPSISSVSYGAQSMTQVDYLGNSPSGYTLGSYILVNPTNGSANLSVSTGGSGLTYQVAYWSLYNTAQSGQPSAHTMQGSGGTNTVTLTTTQNGSMVFGGVVEAQFTSGTVKWENVVSNSTCDSGIVYPSGTGVTGVTSNNPNNVAMLEVKPFTAPSGDAVFPASSATAAYANTRSQFINPYSTFIGFAAAGATIGQSVSVITNGVVTGLSGLNNYPPAQYYLNDTAGTIGISAGTNSRKVGISLSSTTLLITNNW